METTTLILIVLAIAAFTYPFCMIFKNLLYNSYASLLGGLSCGTGLVGGLIVMTNFFPG